MIKVFLVEDEKIIRESIKNNVKWEENGFEFAGEAPDGEMALPMIETTSRYRDHRYQDAIYGWT